MKAIGITCGIGSMLIGARNAGFDIMGNIEWRRYYHARDEVGRNTFEENFPGSHFVKSISDLDPEAFESMMNADIALGHPECGNYSIMNQNRTQMNKPGDIPLFISLVKELRPRFFVQDNLPGCFNGVPMEFWINELPEYDLFPEWISNYHYGNIQKTRKRFFMIGSLKEENFIFVPGEEENNTTLEQHLSNIGPEVQNHNLHVDSGKCGKVRCDLSGGKNGDFSDTYMDEGSWENFQKYFSGRPDGDVMKYVNQKGIVTPRIGTSKGYWNGHSHLLDGSSLSTHPRRNLPFTVRERARIQGCPDDFVFYGEKLPFNHERNMVMVKQTGKFMPVQFCEFVSRQIAAHIKGEEFKCSGKRMISGRDIITEAKQITCNNQGNGDGKICDECWMAGKCPNKQIEFKL